MPLKSWAQMFKMRQLEKEGKLPKGTVKQWIKETPSLKRLPKKKGKK